MLRNDSSNTLEHSEHSTEHSVHGVLDSEEKEEFKNKDQEKIMLKLFSSKKRKLTNAEKKLKKEEAAQRQ